MMNTIMNIIIFITIIPKFYQSPPSIYSTYLDMFFFHSRVAEPQPIHQQDMSKDKRSIQKLRREVEKTKRALSSTHQARASTKRGNREAMTWWNYVKLVGCHGRDFNDV